MADSPFTFIGNSLGFDVYQDDRGGEVICKPGTKPEAVVDQARTRAAGSAQEMLRSEIKAVARRRIEARYPETKQRNMLERELDFMRLFVNGETQSKEDAAEWMDIRDAWDWIRLVRKASNMIEASPIKEDITKDRRWPA